MALLNEVDSHDFLLHQLLRDYCPSKEWSFASSSLMFMSTTVVWEPVGFLLMFSATFVYPKPTIQQQNLWIVSTWGIMVELGI